MSAAAEMARAEADEVEAAEAAEADTPDDETAEAEAEAEPSSNVKLSKDQQRLASEDERHAKRVAQIMGEDFGLLYPCQHCQVVAAGFTFDAPEKTPTLVRAPEYVTCEKCNGYGLVLTGSRNEIGATQTCRGCNGQGYTEEPLPPLYPEPAPAIDASAYGNVATNVNEAAVNALIAAGYMVLPPATPPPTG